MSGLHRWTIGLATTTGLLSLTVTSSIAVLAHHFVEEFSRPHTLLDTSAFTWKVPEDGVEPPASLQRALLFEASDGTLLCGDFWAQETLAPTVILCHGYRISRSHMRAIAASEHRHGYNVFFFDFRGHGDSDSVLTSGGNAEVRDLEAAIEVAIRQPETIADKIIIHGFSMGASVALLTPPHPAVAAIVADSPYARSDDIMRRIVQYQLTQQSKQWPSPLRRLKFLFPTIAWAITSTGFMFFHVRFGYNVVARPDITFRRWKNRAKKMLQQRAIPILLVHSMQDELIPFTHAQQIAAEAKACDTPLETYFVENGLHCGAYAQNPQQYTHVLLVFLQRALGDDFPRQSEKSA